MSFSRDYAAIIDVDASELVCQERVWDGDKRSSTEGNRYILLNIFSAPIIDEVAATQEFGENPDEDGNAALSEALPKGIGRLYFAQSGSTYQPGFSPDEARQSFMEFADWSKVQYLP